MDKNSTLPVATHIGAVELAVSQLNRSLDFYTNQLGFHLLSREGPQATLSAGDQLILLALHERPGARPKPAHSTGLYHFAILTPSRLHLARSLRRLMELRYPLQGASDHLVSEALYLADPDGNGIEIYADRPRNTWPKVGGEVRMSTDPLDFDGLMAELRADGGPWQGLPVGTTIGHVHLQVRDIVEARSFYCDVLGFDLTQRYGASALFVSAGGYHHHVGLNTWASAGAPPPPATAAGLVRYDIVLPDEGALNAMQERLQQAQIVWSAGDGSLDLVDPSGNGIQVRVDELQANKQ